MDFQDCEGLDGLMSIDVDFTGDDYGFTFNGDLTSEGCDINYTNYGYAITGTSIALTGSFNVDCGADGSVGCDFEGTEPLDSESDTFITDLVNLYEERCDTI
ncbi:hypothetical protein K1X76_10365 [bacterium]|nr:hypothetical protein [bacterium]